MRRGIKRKKIVHLYRAAHVSPYTATQNMKSAISSSGKENREAAQVPPFCVRVVQLLALHIRTPPPVLSGPGSLGGPVRPTMVIKSNNIFARLARFSL